MEGKTNVYVMCHHKTNLYLLNLVKLIEIRIKTMIPFAGMFSFK